jgi:hypothetical protein
MTINILVEVSERVLGFSQAFEVTNKEVIFFFICFNCLVPMTYNFSFS